MDADRIVYLAALLADQADMPMDHATPCLHRTLDAFKQEVTDHLGEEFLENAIYCLSTDSFRSSLLSTYKSNRHGRWKPPHRRLLEQEFLDMVPSMKVRGYEADDLVGIIATRSKDAIVVSNDKDLNQIPGKHFNPAKGEVYDVSEEEARYQVYYQWICGDTSDGYSGIPRVGDVKTRDFLAGINLENISDKEASEHVRSLYKKRRSGHLCETMRRVSRIRTDVLGA